MLTVLHRGPDGSEHTFEARSVIRSNKDGVECVPAGGEIRAHGVEGLSDTMTLDISGPFGAVFVMNRHGTTVARYIGKGSPASEYELSIE